MELPVEILCKILSYVDGASLIRCRRVCKLWQSVVCSHELVSEERWEAICRREILPEFLSDIISKLHPSYFTKNNESISWKLVYVCWYRWRGLNSWPVKVNTPKIDGVRKISCLKVSGNWLIYGAADRGTLTAYDLHSGKYRLLLNGWGIDDFILTAAKGINCCEDYPKLPHDELFVCTNNRYTFLFDLQHLKITDLFFHSKPFDQEWLCVINTAASKKMKTVCGSSFKDVGWLTRPINSWRWLQLHYNVALGYTFRTPGQVLFAVGSVYKVLPTSINFDCISTALLHADNFFVSTKNGFIYRYRIKKHEDLLSLDFNNYDWSLKVHGPKECVRSIDVCEMYLKPCIVIAMESKILLIFFSEGLEKSVFELRDG